MSDKNSNKKASEEKIIRDSTNFLIRQDRANFSELYGSATTDPPPPPPPSKKEKKEEKDK